mmetsp:Transcript_24977/g.33099  ORF Transcript_24977/g.33099 Transcript_24977/m.33099 type:complete len:93 (-) Transcript_24977:695-973(-)
MKRRTGGSSQLKAKKQLIKYKNNQKNPSTISAWWGYCHSQKCSCPPHRKEPSTFTTRSLGCIDKGSFSSSLLSDEQKTESTSPLSSVCLANS